MKQAGRCLAIIFGICVFNSAHATSFRVMSEQEKLQMADYHCAVLMTEVSTNLTGDNVSSEGRAKIIQCFKGELESPIKIRWPGGAYEKLHEDGHKESLRTLIPGAPELRVGEAYILSLRKSGKEPGSFEIQSWDIKPIEPVAESYQIENRFRPKLSPEGMVTTTKQNLEDYSTWVKETLGK